MDVTAAIDVWADGPEPLRQLGSIDQRFKCVFSLEPRWDGDRVMTGDHEASDRLGAGEDFARAHELVTAKFSAGRDARASWVKPQDRRIRGEPAQPRIRSLGRKITEIVLKAAGVMGVEGVTVVVAGNDRHPSGVAQPIQPGRLGPLETRPAGRSW